MTHFLTHIGELATIRKHYIELRGSADYQRLTRAEQSSIDDLIHTLKVARLALTSVLQQLKEQPDGLTHLALEAHNLPPAIVMGLQGFAETADAKEPETMKKYKLTAEEKNIPNWCVDAFNEGFHAMPMHKIGYEGCIRKGLVKVFQECADRTQHRIDYDNTTLQESREGRWILGNLGYRSG